MEYLILRKMENLSNAESKLEIFYFESLQWIFFSQIFFLSSLGSRDLRARVLWFLQNVQILVKHELFLYTAF